MSCGRGSFAPSVTIAAFFAPNAGSRQASPILRFEKIVSDVAWPSRPARRSAGLVRLQVSPMPRYQLAIVDDQSSHVDALVELVRDAARAASVQLDLATFTDATAFRGWLRGGGCPDIVLLDILFDGKTGEGISLGEEINQVAPAAQIIYVTGYIEYCTGVYETDHVYFLVKPVNPEDLRKALHKAAVALSSRARSRLEVKFGGRSVLLDTASIAYIESDGRKAHIHCRDGVFETYAKLSELLGLLPASFVQCHKSFLVNLDHVARIEPDKFLLKGDEEVPVSRRCSREVRDVWKRYLLGKL